jgi:sialate O-acetylesterase
MLFTSVGGTPIEAWMSAESLSSLPEGKRLDVIYQKQIQDYPAQKADFDALTTKWQADTAAAAAAGKPAPPPLPKPPRDPSQNYPNRLFNAMVAPLIPFPIKGVILYQGESNGGNGLGYRSLLPAMINDWRTRWNENFPFCIVQIASFKGGDPMIREAQFLTLSKVTNTALVVTTDVGDPNDIHPPNKRPMGERLGLAALALAYGGKDEYSGPLFDSATTDGSKMVIHFTHATKLAAKDGPLTGFVIAGDDKKFVPANAVIVGNTVVVSAASVPTPVAVRYSFDHITLGNLVNDAGLPASPFRTDVDPDRQY